jgi:hypothetical protein
MNKVALILLTTALLLKAAFAQSTTGRLLGTVQGLDGTVSGATLVITDNLTKKEIAVTANEDGTFVVPNLNAGFYTVEVTAPGYKTFVAENLKIDVGQDYRLNPKLELGEILVKITVTAGADVVNSSDAALNFTIGPEQLANLPIFGRDPQALIQLQPGVTQAGSINGQRTSATNYKRDGLNVQDNFIRTGGYNPDLPKIDDVAEFSITTQNAEANQGQGGSSQVSFVTPRGGSDYHGGVYLYNQNAALASNTFFNNRVSDPKPPLNQNQFGGKFSGHLPFPYFRDQAFFFFNYEGLRLPQTLRVNRVILTPSARQGVFTYLDNNGVRRQDNILTIQGLTLSPVIAQRILQGMPTQGNNNDVGDGLNTTGYQFSQRFDFTRDATATRVDFDLNSKNTINFVWTRRWEIILRPDTDGGGFNTQPYGSQTATTNLYVGTYTWTPSSRFSNEVRGGFQGSNPFFNTSGLPQDFFIGNPLTDNVENSFLPQGRTTRYYNLQDNADFRVRQHNLRFGYNGDFFRIESFFGATLPAYFLDNTFGPFGFVGAPGELSGPLTDPNQLAVANALQSLLAGLVGSASNTFNVTGKTSGYVAGAPSIQTFNYSNHGFYLTDQWRVRPNLSVNLGLRYELLTGIRDPHGLRLEPVIPPGTDPVAAILNPSGTYNYVGGNAGSDGQFFKTDKNNWAPNVSIAYTLESRNRFLRRALGDQSTVVRAGYRISYINDEYVRATDFALANNSGLSQTVRLTGLDARISNPPPIPTPAFTQPPITYARNNALAGNFGIIFGVDPNIQVPRVHEYNFGLQRNLGDQTALEIRYVGAQSDQLFRTIDYNQVDIRDNGFAEDFIRARQNLILSGNTSGAYNPAIPGSQPLTVFPNLAGGGLLSNNAVRTRLLGGIAADLAILYIQNRLTGSVKFLANPNTGSAFLLRSVGEFNYNSLQVEVRRRLSRGLYFQANYTFQKILTDISPANPGFGADDQTRVSAFLDNQNKRLDYARADYDQTHIFNFNGSYDLPFGNGRRFLSATNPLLDRLLSGWTLGSVVRINTGFPLTIVDRRGTLNRAARSARQAPQTSLTQGQIKDLIGLREVNGKIYYIDPKVINPADGRGAVGFGQTPFPGQVFFNNGPGQTGNLQRSFINGPLFAQVDASLIKNIRITERVRFQLRADAFNLFNRTNFFAGTAAGAIFNINLPTFGQITDQFTIFGLNRVIQVAGRIDF